jgi:hypothetical protein
LQKSVESKIDTTDNKNEEKTGLTHIQSIEQSREKSIFDITQNNDVLKMNKSNNIFEGKFLGSFKIKIYSYPKKQ